MGRRRYYRRKSYSGKGGNPFVLLGFLVAGFLYNYWEAVLAIALIACAVWLVWYLNKKRKEDTETSDENMIESPTMLTLGFVQGTGTTQPEDMPTTTATQEEPVQEAYHQVYSAKTSFMTECERGFFEVIREIVEPRYTVQPQVNLASVIDKEAHSRYRNELFRNVDFGIFDKDYRLLIMVEINDQTHLSYERRNRDQKVKQICAEAKIPLVTLWTKYGINKTYIRSRLAEYLNLDEEAGQK